MRDLHPLRTGSAAPLSHRQHRVHIRRGVRWHAGGGRRRHGAKWRRGHWPRRPGLARLRGGRLTAARAG
ncbi:hypothetical protein, partial [Trebonia sp.]|uniref:hypothetical protein n=1 Tax=Trebonia sp. TaxID=2767075 RepID=UPI00261090BF